MNHMEPRHDDRRARHDRTRKPGTTSFLLGVGLDGTDGHHRITRGDGFRRVGGSEETHERMQEAVIRMVEKPERRGRNIPNSSIEELGDLLEESR